MASASREYELICSTIQGLELEIKEHRNRIKNLEVERGLRVIEKANFMKRNGVEKDQKGKTVSDYEKVYDLEKKIKKPSNRMTKEKKEKIQTKRIEICRDEGIRDPPNFLQKVMKPEIDSE